MRSLPPQCTELEKTSGIINISNSLEVEQKDSHDLFAFIESSSKVANSLVSIDIYVIGEVERVPI